MEFTQFLPSPTSLIALGMKPYDGNAVLEINPSLVFPILEMLLGGTGKVATKIDPRDHGNRAEHPGRAAAHYPAGSAHLLAARSPRIEFSIEAHETEPQLLQILAPNEAVVAISMEVRIGETSGMMNIGIPSIIVKMLRQKFDQQWSVRKTQSTDEEHARMLRLIRPAQIHLDARLQGPTVGVQGCWICRKATAGVRLSGRTACRSFW